MTTRIRRSGALLSVATALWWGHAAPAQAGPIIDWFKSLCPQSAPPANMSTCNKGAANSPTPGTYYPGTTIPPAVVPGAVIPGTVQPGYAQPGYVQPGYAQPGTAFPNTVTPGPAFPPRTANYYPGVAQAVYYPGTVAASPVMRAPNAQVAYYAPVAAGGAPCPTCPRPNPTGANRPTTVNYAPYTSFRNSWVQVPVTVYRPVSAIDPATGQPVTVVQPCLTSTWQVQRVPVGGRPFVSMYQPLPVSGYGSPGMATPTAVAPGACPGGACAPAAPAASWGGTVMPGTTLAPSTTIPAAPPNTASPPSTFGPNTQPSYLGQPARIAPGTSGGTFSPADQRPTLGPSEGAGSSNYPPATDPYPNPPPYLGPSVPANGASNGAATGGALTNPSAASPSSVTRPAESKSAPRLPIKVTPVPDPESSPAELPGRSAPRLIVPQERTAASRGTQPTHRIVPAITVENTRPSTAVGKPVTWDDSGWRSGRP